MPVLEKDNNCINITNPVDSNELTGGDKRKCNILPDISHHVEHLKSPIWEDAVKQEYEIKQLIGQYPINRINPTKYQSLLELFTAISQHAMRWQRLSLSTIDHRLRCARRMLVHPVFPIDFFNLTYEQFISYLNYREDVEKAQYFALENDLRAIQMFLTAYGTKSSDWFYRLPAKPRHKGRKIPLPDIVYQIINYKYSEDHYANNLYQTLHAHNFWIGWRVPSEICALKINDVDFENGCITITETKKHRNTRTIYPDIAVLTGRTRKSFKNYLDKWRPQRECSKSGDAFYLSPKGLPFTPRHLGHQLSETGKLVYPDFQPYVSRHWNAIAMLIRTKLETGRFEEHTVRKWLGHDKITTTYTYIDDTDVYYKKAPYDWIRRTLKFDRIIEGDSALKSKQGKKTFVSFGKSGENDYGLSGI